MKAILLALALFAALGAQIDRPIFPAAADTRSLPIAAQPIHQQGISGVVRLDQSPPPGSIFQGDGQAVLKVAADDVAVVGCTFDGVSIQSLADVQRTKIIGNRIRGVRKATDCYYGGGQAIQVSNARDAGRKLIVDNVIEDFDCIAVSLYNLGPVHNVMVAGNSDDGTGLWASYGPAPEPFSDITWVGNHFRSPVRIGHGHWLPQANGVTVAGNVFEGEVMYEFRNPRPQAVECGNDYRAGRSLTGMLFVPRARVQPCPL